MGVTNSSPASSGGSISVHRPRRNRPHVPLGLAVALAAALAGSAAGGGPQAEGGDLFTEARDVLERRCLVCHGGDHRESGLSFADATTFALGGARGPVVDAQDPAKSRLLAVISYADPDLAMPPSGVLPGDERAILEAWVNAGAPWPAGDAGRLADPAAHPLEDGAGEVQPWWAYDPLERPAAPRVEDAEWSRTAPDAFLYAKMGEEGLEPAPEAEPEALLRRATFDLTGLPPTPAERAAFLAGVEEDGFDAAWSALLDRLFASPHYAEHQARHWLDLVRYAETNGYERDAKKRNMWRYRDWVVRAFDRDLPYDRFLQLQLAGDELVGTAADPAERADALLATGYHRVGVWDDEPADPNQATADEIASIVDTSAQVFMATTMGCARCHDHKADPVTQKEYFELTAHFAGLIGYGGGGFGQSKGAGATLPVPDPEDAGRMTRNERQTAVHQVEGRIELAVPKLGLEAPDASGAEVLVADARSADGPATWRYTTDVRDPSWTTPGFDDGAWREGLGGFGRENTPNAHVGTPWTSEDIRLRTTFRLDAIPETLGLSIHHDEDVAVYLNGVRILDRTRWVTNYFRVQLGREALDALVVGRNVLAVECHQTVGGQYVDVGLDTGFEPTAQRARLALAERAVLASPDAPELEGLAALFAERERLRATPVAESYPAQVAFETPVPPVQHVHLRGSVHAPGDVVEPGLPAAWTYGARSDAQELPAWTRPEGVQGSGRRARLALWLTGGGAHLAARVEANRQWQFLFGRGLCRTPGDFGRLGERPTHPELLDWLSVELIENGWSRKALQRTLMETRAYRASSVPSAEVLAADPRNDAFAWFSPRRLTAEEFRDAALAASGELERERFGPSVFPPLPAEVLATASRPDAAWGQSSPRDAARRSLYVHVKRTLREPLLAALDQPDPDLPCPERFPTNVPTQALLTLNGDFVRARAAAFRRSVEAEVETLEGRIERSIVRALGRAAAPTELSRALRLVETLGTEHGLDEAAAFEVFLLGLLNRNEFLWLD